MMSKVFEQVAQVYGVETQEVKTEIQLALQTAIDEDRNGGSGFWEDIFERRSVVELDEILAFICIKAFEANMNDNENLQQILKTEYTNQDISA